jgi:hypothetical protein
MLSSRRRGVTPAHLIDSPVRRPLVCSQLGLAHAWGCPKVPKLDPEHVAWTCARCGSIAVTERLEVQPPA